MGRYRNQHLNGHAGLILNPRELDLRLFLNHWTSVFAMSETNKRGVRHSIQFFDQQGDALHKVYTTEETDLPAWMALVERHLSEENPALALQPTEASTADETTQDHAKIDGEWRAMTDVHQFFQLLSRNKLTRQQAFRAVGDDLAYQVDNSALSQLLEAAQQQQNEIMIFVGNRGCVQIFTGQIERLMPQEGWINVFNRRFTLHLIEDAIAESWITRKPTKDGIVTSLELFAADGTQIAQLYGQRTEGQPEQTQWREQVAALAARTSPHEIFLDPPPGVDDGAGAAAHRCGGAAHRLDRRRRDGNRLRTGRRRRGDRPRQHQSAPGSGEKLPDVGYMRQLNAEGILALKPTLVLTTELAQPALVLKQLADSGVNVVSVPGDTTLQAVPQKIATIAAALQRVEQGKQLSERYQQQLAAVDTSPLPVKVLFVMSHGGITPMAAGQHTAADAVIAAAGLKNAMQGFDRYRPLSQEGVIASAPDLLLVTTDGVRTLGGEQQLWTLPGLALTPAGKQRRVLIVDDMALLGFGLETPAALAKLRHAAEQK